MLSRLRARLARSRVGFAVFGGYAVVGFLYLGLPLFVQPGSRYVGYGYDPQIFIWAFAWWPHAILHGENPFVTHAVWAPDGVNLTWTTTVPGLALVFSPLTLAAGPFVSYDVAAILMPVLAAWTAFVLCRHLTRALWPSLVGGYLFGFSSYVLAQGGGGHLQLSSVFLLPLVALVLLRFLDGELDGGGLVLRLAPMLAFQALIATEVAFTLALALAAALVLCVVFVPARRRRVGQLLRPLTGAYALGGLLIVPFLYFLLTGFRRGSVSNPDSYNADLLNFVVPTKIAYVARGWASAIADRFPANVTEQDAYLGMPVLVILGLYARERFRSPAGRFLLAGLAVGIVAALGSTVTVDGHGIVSLPWKLVGTRPAFDDVLTTRLTVYVEMAAAVVVALWIAARGPGRLRWALPVLAVLALVPNPDLGGFATRYHVPAFFTDGAYRRCVAPGAIVLPLPIREDGDELLWQVESEFRFNLAGGEIGPVVPASFQTPGAMSFIVQGNPVAPGQAGMLRTFIANKEVSVVIVDRSQARNWAGALDRIARPRTIGGVVLYRVAGEAPSCTGS